MVFRAAGDDALEHIRQIGLRVETIEFGGVEKRGRDCRSTIATGEKRVLTAQLYKFLFDLTDGGNWLVDVHASS
jgi:hypothetical protein